MSLTKSVSNPSLVSIALLCLLLAAPASATSSDSFFDIWIEAQTHPSAPLVLELSNAPTTYQTVDTEMLSMSLSGRRAPIVTSDLGDGNFTVDSFFDIDYRTDDGGGNFTVDSFFDIEVEIAFTLTSSSVDHREWDTEILSMDLRSSAPAGGSSTRPALAAALDHRGHVTVLKIAAGGGGSGGGGGDQFRVDSFFDIWTEVSVDGGGSYHPANGASNVAGTTVVPEPSTGALIGLGLGALALRRRRS